jgi:hypothetical protein
MYIFLLFIPLVFIIFIAFHEVPFIKETINYNRLDREYLLKFSSEDDSDMKIADLNRKNQADNTILEVSEMQKQKENGNLNKAKQLGELLFKQVINVYGEAIFGLDVKEDNDIQMQRRILLAFTVIYSVEVFIKNGIVNKAVENAFYNKLRANNFELYNNLRESGAFSFYYLCIRHNENIEEDIGRAFAMLAGSGKDKIMQELGTALFVHYYDVIKNSIDSINFLDIW